MTVNGGVGRGPSSARGLKYNVGRAVRVNQCCCARFLPSRLGDVPTCVRPVRTYQLLCFPECVHAVVLQADYVRAPSLAELPCGDVYDQASFCVVGDTRAAIERATDNGARFGCRCRRQVWRCRCRRDGPVSGRGWWTGMCLCRDPPSRRYPSGQQQKQL